MLQLAVNWGRKIWLYFDFGDLLIFLLTHHSWLEVRSWKLWIIQAVFI